MKKITSIILSVVLSFSIIGCNILGNSVEGMTPTEIVQKFDKNSNEVKELNQKNSNLKKEQVLKKVEEELKNVKSLESTYFVSIQKLDEKGEKKEVPSEYTVKVKTLYDEEGKLQEVYNTLQFTGDEKITGSYVDLKNNKTFVNQGDGLKEYKVTKDSEIQVNNESEYKNIVKMMGIASQYMDFSEDDQNYYLSFKGKNGELLFKIDGLFGLGIDLMGLDKLDMDVKYTIRKADFAVTTVEHNVKQVYQAEDYDSLGKFTIDSINTMKEIEEVKDLASK